MLQNFDVQALRLIAKAQCLGFRAAPTGISHTQVSNVQYFRNILRAHRYMLHENIEKSQIDNSTHIDTDPYYILYSLQTSIKHTILLCIYIYIYLFIHLQIPLTVQAPNDHILAQNRYYTCSCPNPKYLIIGYLDA